MEGRQPADDQPRPPLRAGDDDRHDHHRTSSSRTTGRRASARRTTLTGDGKTKLYGNYGIFYARIPNDLAARALSADDGFTRGDYFDAEPDAADPGGRDERRRPAAPTTTPLHPARASARTRSIRTPSCRYTERVRDRHRARDHAEHDVRRPLRAPQHAARARGRRELPDGGLRARRDASASAAASSTSSRIRAARRRSTRRRSRCPGVRGGQVRRPGPQLQRGRGHAQPPRRRTGRR